GGDQVLSLAEPGEVQPRNSPASGGPEHDRRTDKLPGGPRSNVLRSPAFPGRVPPVDNDVLVARGTQDAKVGLPCLHPARMAPRAIASPSHLAPSFRACRATALSNATPQIPAPRLSSTLGSRGGTSSDRPVARATRFPSQRTSELNMGISFVQDVWVSDSAGGTARGNET